MSIIYKNVKVVFNQKMFSDTLKSIDLNDYELAEIMDVDISTIENWKSMYKSPKGFHHPRMANFLKLMNLLDYPPSRANDFFCLEDNAQETQVFPLSS